MTRPSSNNKQPPAKRERRYVNPFTGVLLQQVQTRSETFSLQPNNFIATY
jgi:hypothetical protein